jgi:probable rRNA maturation factor
MITVKISEEGKLKKYRNITDAKIRATVKKTCALLELDNVLINIILTDNRFIHTINRDYRAKDRPTDVISFAYREEPFPQPAKGKENLGDIFLSLEQAEIQRIEYGVTFIEECERLLIHSVLHLIGFDHERSKKDEKIMRAKEDWILERL